ncbi:hypothetical protein [Demequina litorisediminis]|uniref:hypothetical protein n=1 Tax=Demequina litorisediminis TaxID=1849022 RepID=UPI0024E144CA|nr:hypothetical protein [Demequina litorisediminis]
MSALEKAFTSKPGKAIAAKAGLKEPPRLRRGRTWPEGAIVLAQIGDGTLARRTLWLLGRSVESPVVDDGGDPAPGYGSRIGALVVDATGLTRIAQARGTPGSAAARGARHRACRTHRGDRAPQRRRLGTAHGGASPRWDQPHRRQGACAAAPPPRSCTSNPMPAPATSCPRWASCSRDAPRSWTGRRGRLPPPTSPPRA